MVTSGVIDAHESVMPPPVGVRYPYSGLTVTVPWAPLPAGTLVGATAPVTLIVKAGDTASTVSGSAGAVYVVVGPVPVIVMPYAWVVVVLWVVTVAVVVAGEVTDAGLTMHWGGFVAACCPVTWQLKLTVTPGLEGVGRPTIISAEETPLGATASGVNDSAVSVNSDVPWAIAADAHTTATHKQAANRHTGPIALCPAVDFILDSDHTDLNMNGFWFN
jgi:hypothetical protein